MPNMHRRPALADLLLWEQESVRLKLAVTPELTVLRALLARVASWQSQVNVSDAASAMRWLRQAMVRAYTHTHTPPKHTHTHTCRLLCLTSTMHAWWGVGWHRYWAWRPQKKTR
jgi:hypothetical protein